MGSRRSNKAAYSFISRALSLLVVGGAHMEDMSAGRTGNEKGGEPLLGAGPDSDTVGEGGRGAAGCLPDLEDRVLRLDMV